jgi:hypothetical protein
MDMVDAINYCTDCPRNCPCQLPKPGLRSQRQPSRSIGEVVETRGFARKNDDGPNADRRLANRRLQPLGHLTVREFPKDLADSRFRKQLRTG